MAFNPVPYTVGVGLGASEGYHFGHKKDKKGSKVHGYLGAALGTVGGPLGVHAGKKQIKDLVTIAKELMEEGGVTKTATELPSLHKVPKLSDMVEGESPGAVISSLGLGTAAGVGAHRAATALKASPRVAALLAASFAALGDQDGRSLYHKHLERRLEKSDNKYLRQAAKE
jgi:hypothetical protein